MDTLGEEPALEAVTLDPAQQKISVATLGRIPQGGMEKLTRRLTDRFHSAQGADLGHACLLLDGKGDCATCGSPLSAAERKNITIQRDGASTTIARVTCPTAPKFWRWRDIPFPKVVPRQIELPEDDHGIDEWKPQLAAAILCGGFGLSGHLLGKFGLPALSVASFIAAYITGAWFTVHEVWERLQQRAIDVHFLMLAVAVGAASIGAWVEGATLLFLFSFSGALEHYALGRTQKEIRSLFRDAPKTATAIDAAGNETEVPVEKICAGARLLIKPGAQFPVDAEIVKGTTAADESNLTGEAAPVEKSIGDTALAGTINLWGVVEVVLVFNGYSEMPFVSLALGLAGALAVISLSALMAKSDLFKPLRYCGRNSIVIYLAFFLPMAASRSLLLKTGWIADIGTMSALVTAAGVLGALALYWAVRRTPLRFLFDRPDRFWVAPKKAREPLALQPAE